MGKKDRKTDGREPKDFWKAKVFEDGTFKIVGEAGMSEVVGGLISGEAKYVINPETGKALVNIAGDSISESSVIKLGYSKKFADNFSRIKWGKENKSTRTND